MRVFDSHIHIQGAEVGGFIIGLKNSGMTECANEVVLKKHDLKKKYVSFYYVSNQDIDRTFSHKYLKYHPRIEKYSLNSVVSSIERNHPKIVIIDSLNEPFWQPYDYWNVARRFPEMPVLLAHAGGYLINDFIKICHFQKNVWLDFSCTHTILGCLGDKDIGLTYINDAIRYAFNAPFKNRVLLGSDWPFYSQEEVFNYYTDYIPLLNNNFISLLEAIK